MPKTVTIRVVNDDNPRQCFDFKTNKELWNKFEALAKSKHIPTGKLLEIAITEYDKEHK